MSAYTKQLLKFADVLTRLHTQTTTPADYTTTLTTLSTITHNLATTPLQPRYTTLNLNLPILQRRLVRYPAALEWLRLIGFEQDDGEATGVEGGERMVLRGELDKKVVEVAVQVIEGGLEEAKLDEEKAAGTQQQPPSRDRANSGDVDIRSSQEEEDRKLGERLQREENSRNNRTTKAPAAAAEPVEEQRETDADMRVNLQADYNISDVKRALSALKQQIQSALSNSSSSSSSSSASLSSSSSSLPIIDSHNHAASDAYLASLNLLHKLTTNLLPTNQQQPPHDKYRTLKLSNPTLHSKLACYPAALDYLRFLGFEERSEEGEEGVMRVERVDGVRVERAAAILQRVIQAETPSDEEREHRMLGAVDRELRVMEYEPAVLNERLAAREEEPSDAPDLKLLLTVAAEDRRRNEMYSRTDAFLTRNKQAELKQRYKRHYTRTLLRVVCQPDNSIITAYFRPLETLASLFTLLTPLLQPDKATTAVLRLPPQQKLTLHNDGHKTVQSLGLVPAATLLIGDTDATATPTRWLRDEVWQGRTGMVVVPVPVAENAAEIAEKKREDRMALGGGGGGEASGRGGGAGSEKKGDGDEMDEEALERELKRMKAEKAKKKSAAADAASKRVAR